MIRISIGPAKRDIHIRIYWRPREKYRVWFMKVIVSGVGTGVQPSRVSFIITSTEEEKKNTPCVWEAEPRPLSLYLSTVCVASHFGLIPPSCVGPGVIVIFVERRMHWFFFSSSEKERNVSGRVCVVQANGEWFHLDKPVVSGILSPRSRLSLACIFFFFGVGLLINCGAKESRSFVRDSFRLLKVVALVSPVCLRKEEEGPRFQRAPLVVFWNNPFSTRRKERERNGSLLKHWEDSSENNTTTTSFSHLSSNRRRCCCCILFCLATFLQAEMARLPGQK